jgi:hypothetical protein
VLELQLATVRTVSTLDEMDVASTYVVSCICCLCCLCCLFDVGFGCCWQETARRLQLHVQEMVTSAETALALAKTAQRKITLLTSPSDLPVGQNAVAAAQAMGSVWPPQISAAEFVAASPAADDNYAADLIEEKLDQRVEEGEQAVRNAGETVRAALDAVQTSTQATHELVTKSVCRAGDLADDAIRLMSLPDHKYQIPTDKDIAEARAVQGERQ